MASLFPTSVRRGIKASSLLSLTSRSTIISSSLHSQQIPIKTSSLYSSSRTSHIPPPDKMSTALSSQTFIDLAKTRRTIYALSNKSPISDARIQEIVEAAILHVPSSFNSQTTRVILLLKQEHEKLWDITKEVLKGVVPADQFAATEQKINGFRAGYGTILFFEHRPSIAAMQSAFALYADKFPIWAHQTSAMHQYALWTALAADGLGASLQHYSPLIDAKIQEQWGVDKDWELNAQLVFGTPVAPAGEKTTKPLEERLRVFGK